jgi:dTMP kinase
MSRGDPLICISGGDGCGKSTLVAGLARALPGARVVNIWDGLADPNIAAVFSSKARLYDFLGALSSGSRALFMSTCMKEAMERAPRGLRLVDAYWYKYLASEIALGLAPAQAEALGALFERPSLTVRVALSPELAAERKRGDYSPYECGLRAPTREHFVDFQGRIGPIIQSLVETDARDVVTLDGAASQGWVFEHALASVQRVVA